VKLVAYLRVSTVGQARDGLGLATQQRMVRAWARQHGHAVVRVVSDEGRSGTLDETERPGLLDVLTVVRNGEAAGVVVTSLDRLARSLTVQEAVLGKLWALGGTVYCADTGEVPKDDPDDPMRSAMRQMAGVFAELDRKLVIKRLRAGKATKAAMGGYVGGGQRYGLRAEGGELVQDDEERVVVELVRELRAAGLSYRAIGRELEERGHRPRRAAEWSAESIRQIAQR